MFKAKVDYRIGICYKITMNITREIEQREYDLPQLLSSPFYKNLIGLVGDPYLSLNQKETDPVWMLRPYLANHLLEQLALGAELKLIKEEGWQNMAHKWLANQPTKEYIGTLGKMPENQFPYTIYEGYWRFAYWGRTSQAVERATLKAQQTRGILPNRRRDLFSFATIQAGIHAHDVAQLNVQLVKNAFLELRTQTDPDNMVCLSMIELPNASARHLSTYEILTKQTTELASTRPWLQPATSQINS